MAKRKKLLNFGGNLGLLRFGKKNTKNSNTVAACCGRSKGNDPEALGLAFHHQGPTFINAYCQAGEASVALYAMPNPFLLNKTCSKQAARNLVYGDI